MKRVSVVAALLAAGALAFLLWPREAAQEKPHSDENAVEAALPGPAPQTAGGSNPRLVAGGRRSEARDAVAESGAPGTTPPLPVPASAKDGFVEVRVMAQGKPVGAAKVRLYLRGKRDRNTSEIDWRFAGAAETAPNGLARIPARPGSYLVAARSGTLAPARHEFQRPAGEAVTKVTLEMQPGASISGRTVQKEGKDPVPLALVTLTWVARSGSRMRPDAPAEEQARATSDENGRFRIDGLSPGAYRAQAQATGFSRASARAEAPSAKDVMLEMAAASFIEGRVITAEGKPAAAAEVMATSGFEDAVVGAASDTGTFSIEVRPRTWMLAAKLGDQSGRADQPVAVAAGATARGVKIELGAGCGITGTVAGALTHLPIPGAQIAVSPHNANGDSGRAVSDASGAFAVAGLAPGSYDAAISADGYSEQDARGLTVQAGQMFPLRIELHQTGSISGTVNDSAGRGVSSALVQTLPRFGFGPGGPGAAGAPIESRADQAGNYQLTAVPAGRVSVTATRDGSALGASGSADVPEGGAARVDLQLKDEGTLAGHVRRKDGSPAPPDATVRAVPSGGFRGGPFNGIPLDATGAFAASVPAGSYNLSVMGAGMGFSRAGSVPVTVQAGQTAMQDLVYIGQDDVQGFSGTVLEPGGSPSPAAFVRGTSGGRGGMIFALAADESGRFTTSSLRSDLPDTFTVVASNGGRFGTAQVPPHQTESTVQLQPAAVLQGQLTSGPEENFSVSVGPAADADIPFGGPGANQSLQFTGDRFLMTDVPGVKVQVSVRTQDSRAASQEVALSPGATQQIQIALQQPATVTGRLLDAQTAAPLAAAMVFLDRPARSAGLATTGITGADGRFSLRAPAGDHTLNATPPGYARAQRPLTAQTGQLVDLGDIAVQRL